MCCSDHAKCETMFFVQRTLYTYATVAVMNKLVEVRSYNDLYLLSCDQGSTSNPIFCGRFVLIDPFLPLFDIDEEDEFSEMCEKQGADTYYLRPTYIECKTHDEMDSNDEEVKREMFTFTDESKQVIRDKIGSIMMYSDDDFICNMLLLSDLPKLTSLFSRVKNQQKKLKLEQYLSFLKSV